MALPFTDREMERAWRENRSASRLDQRTNAHRLLLFYAVECGLKALIMKRRGIRNNRTDAYEEFTQTQHNINKLLDHLKVGLTLHLPRDIRMKPITDGRGHLQDRPVGPGRINQMWRYGGRAQGDTTDDLLEARLEAIADYIQRELR